MEKMTYVVALNSAIACDALSAEVREKLTALRDAQEKRTHALRKPTATQNENEGFKSAIAEALSDGNAYTISEMIKAIPVLNEVSNQRASAIVRQMVDSGVLVREEVKRKAYFSLAVAE